MYFSSAVLLPVAVASIYKVLKIQNLHYVLDSTQLQRVEGGKLDTYIQNAMNNKYKEDYG